MWFHHSKRNDAMVFYVKNTKEIFNRYILASEINIIINLVRFGLARSPNNGIYPVDILFDPSINPRMIKK